MMPRDDGSRRRLIGAAFPLKQASLDSVHEKNVRHGHISTLHIWPARRPLAAARAAPTAALLPDPGAPQVRKRLLARIGGRVDRSFARFVDALDAVFRGNGAGDDRRPYRSSAAGTRRVCWREPSGRRATMEATRIAATIRNPAEPDRFWEELFRVDTGAADSLVPGRRLEAIGLAPKGRRAPRSADGADIAMDVTTGDIEFMGEIVGGTILFGADDAEPLLGATALESAGVEVDPRDRRPRRRRAVRLPGIRARAR